MTTKRTILIIISILIVFIIAFMWWQINMIIKAKWSYSNFRLRTASLKELSFYVYFKMRNDSMLSFILAEQDYDIYIDNNYISKAVNKSDTILLAGQQNTVPFLIDLTVSDLLKAGIKDINSILTKEGRDQMTLKVTGFLTIKLGFITIRKVPFNLEKTFAQLQNPDPES